MENENQPDNIDRKGKRKVDDTDEEKFPKKRFDSQGNPIVFHQGGSSSSVQETQPVPAPAAIPDSNINPNQDAAETGGMHVPMAVDGGVRPQPQVGEGSSAPGNQGPVIDPNQDFYSLGFYFSRNRGPLFSRIGGVHPLNDAHDNSAAVFLRDGVRIPPTPTTNFPPPIPQRTEQQVNAPLPPIPTANVVLPIPQETDQEVDDVSADLLSRLGTSSSSANQNPNDGGNDGDRNNEEDDGAIDLLSKFGQAGPSK